MVSSISVIITCYNLELYVGAAIDSVRAQESGVPAEIIVVDDCSTDRSADVIRTYPDVKLVRLTSNSGVLIAMLAGIESSTGDLIFFLDGDDLWLPSKLSRATSAFEADEAISFVTHDLEFMSAEGMQLHRQSRPEEAMAQFAPEEAGEAVRNGILEHKDYVWLGSAFAVRRSLARISEFVDWARRLPDPKNTYQDWTLAYWVAALPDARFAYVPEKLFRYRLHQLNHSGDAATAPKAIRNFTRARNTALAMRAIALLRDLPQSYEHLLYDRAEFLDYLVDLYSGRRARAARGLVRSLGYLRRHGLLLKELTRFAGVQVIGPARFAKAAARRHILKDDPGN